MPPVPQYVKHSSIPTPVMYDEKWYKFEEYKLFIEEYAQLNIDNDSHRLRMIVMVENLPKGRNIVDWNCRFPNDGYYIYKWPTFEQKLHNLIYVPKCLNEPLPEIEIACLKQQHKVIVEYLQKLAHDETDKEKYSERFNQEIFEEYYNVSWQENPEVPPGKLVIGDDVEHELAVQKRLLELGMPSMTDIHRAKLRGKIVYSPHKIEISDEDDDDSSTKSALTISSEGVPASDAASASGSGATTTMPKSASSEIIVITDDSSSSSSELGKEKKPKLS